MDVSERGGEGGVSSVRIVSAFERGGVDVVGDDKFVAEVDVSDRGERGRNESAESISEVLRWWSVSRLFSALRSFSETMSASMRRSDRLSFKRWFSMRSDSRSCSPILIS